MEKTEKIKNFSQLIKFLSDVYSASKENKLSIDIPPTITWLLKWHSENFPINKKETAEKITKLLNFIGKSKYNKLSEIASKDLPHLKV